MSSSPSSSLPSSSWLTRVEQPRDLPAVHELTVAAFGRPYEAELVEALRADEAWIDGLSIVVTEAGATESGESVVTGSPVGHVLLTRAFIGDAPALAMAPVSVHPDHQRSGAGSALVRAGLDAARARGERFVILLGHPSYYPRFGFGRASEHGIALTVDAPDEAWMALSLDPARHPLPSGTARWADAFGIA
ncbi:N-acetyltransferase [Kitasatospora purpeofusca]|uniref:GNAT family N-acetyltransferase n=1 Tax=Kitasatospora purpeofusca TaxID=67352 RepID=UPI002A5ADB73|nr:N-acetyltransferase [Kitasatospora purpeofusca]MDY0811892.1 N-acetyltransferase [Kitasatospora purpeofusca]